MSMSLRESVPLELPTPFACRDATCLTVNIIVANDSRFHFLEAPSFLKTPKPVEVHLGKDASLYCEMYGTPPFQVTWYKDKRPLKESRKYKMVNEGSSAALHIMKLETADAALYECTVSNHVGSETCRATVSLKG